MPYNLTNVTAANNILDLVIVTNNAADGWYISLAVLTLFVIAFVSLLRNNPPAESFTAATFITFLVGLGLNMAGLGGVSLITITALTLTASVVGLYIVNRK